MSRALDDRLPPTVSGLEYTPWYTFRDENGVEDDKGELGAVIRRQARRATPHTRARGNMPVTAHRAESPPIDIMDSDTDGSDIEASTASSQNAMGWKDEEFDTSDLEEGGQVKGDPITENDESTRRENVFVDLNFL
jgi:hypothetical protein